MNDKIIFFKILFLRDVISRANMLAWWILSFIRNLDPGEEVEWTVME